MQPNVDTHSVDIETCVCVWGGDLIIKMLILLYLLLYLM